MILLSRYKKNCNNVFSIELVQYDVPYAITPTWLGTYDYYEMLALGRVNKRNTSSNMDADIRITDETGAHTITFRTTMDPALFFGTLLFPASGSSSDTPFSDFLLIAQEYFAQQTHPVLNSTNYEIVYPSFPITDLDEANNIRTMYCEKLAAPGTYAPLELLFGTGAHRGSQASRPLGFVPGVDTIPDIQYNYGAHPSFSSNPRPFRYINIYLEEPPEFQPFARVYTTDETKSNYVNHCDQPRRSRILKQPIKNMKRLRFKIRGENDIELSFIAEIGLLFTVEVLSIAQVPKVPAWVQQRLVL